MSDPATWYEDDLADDYTPLDWAHGSWDEAEHDEKAAEDPWVYDFRPHLEDPD